MSLEETFSKSACVTPKSTGNEAHRLFDGRLLVGVLRVEQDVSSHHRANAEGHILPQVLHHQ